MSEWVEWDVPGLRKPLEALRLVVLDEVNPEEEVVEEDLVRLEGSGRLLRLLLNILCGWMITGLPG